MPHFPRTPEALIGRNDSKNPASTCRGITSAGRACRRGIAASKTASIGRRTSGTDANELEDGDVPTSDFYCWQHKDQAHANTVNQGRSDLEDGRAKRRSTGLPSLRERTSIDTLVQKLGIDARSEEGRRPMQRSRNPRPPKRTETNDFAAQSASSPILDAEKSELDQPLRRRPKKKLGFWASLCCMVGDDEDYVEIVWHRKRIAQTRPPEMSGVTTPPDSTPNGRVPATTRSASNQIAGSKTPSRPRDQAHSNGQTNNLLSLIPQSLPPQTTSALLAELVKPISPYDEEGYIYIFWLTSSSQPPPAESTAKSLLAPPDSRPQNGRRISDVMTEYSFSGTDDSREEQASRAEKGRTIMLKIGRANNITRRMNEWQRQCGYALNLVRWYPYIPHSSSSPTPSPSPQRTASSQPLYPDLSRTSLPRRESETAVHKCPHIHRVERLIHLELAGQQVKRRCEACGKEHREWFEVEATQAGVRAVDEIVRRWVGWAEGGPQ